jgi:hypothetical protein
VFWSSPIPRSICIPRFYVMIQQLLSYQIIDVDKCRGYNMIELLCVRVEWEEGGGVGQTFLIKPSAPIFTITSSYFCPRTDEYNTVMSLPPFRMHSVYLPANVLFAVALDGDDNLVLRTVWVLLMR